MPQSVLINMLYAHTGRTNFAKEVDPSFDTAGATQLNEQCQCEQAPKYQLSDIVTPLHIKIYIQYI